MTPRIAQELELLRRHYDRVEHVEHAGEDWFRIPDYVIDAAADWGQDQLPVAFKVGAGHPGTAPYGFFVPSGLRFRGQAPQFQDPVSPQPPFPGTTWAHVSWQQDAGQWRPTGDLVTGSNLWNFTRTFRDRFKEGA